MQFTADGYAGATIRGIAAGGRRGPSLVHHYVGAKDDLFLAALNIQ